MKPIVEQKNGENGWTVDYHILREIREYLTNAHDECFSVSEEDVEQIIMALADLGYIGIVKQQEGE